MKQNRIRLCRSVRIARNLLFTLALAAVLWSQFDYPLPTLEANFRRAERRELRQASEVLCTIPSDSGVQILGRTETGLVVGWIRGKDLTDYSLYDYTLSQYPVVIPLQTPVQFVSASGTRQTENAAVAIGVLETAAEASLSLRMDGKAMELEGQKLSNGVYLFYLPEQMNREAEARFYAGEEAVNYRLTAQDASGAFCGDWTGQTLLPN
jgi:hypothetical protein